MSEIRRAIEVANKRGLHARASAKFVTLASTLPVSVEVEKDGSKVCGTSIMGLMMLGAAKGARGLAKSGLFTHRLHHAA